MQAFIKLADDFDKEGFKEEANVIDNFIKIAQESNNLTQIAGILNDQKFIEGAKNAVETMKYLKEMSDNLSGEYADIKRDIDATMMAISNHNADVVPILNRAKNSTIRHIQQITQEKAAMNIDTLVKLSDALDKRGLAKFADRIDGLIEKAAASAMPLIRRRDLLERKRRFYRNKLDALRRRGGPAYDRHHFQLGEKITNLAEEEDALDEDLQQMAQVAGFDDVEKFIRKERIKDSIRGKGLLGILGPSGMPRKRPQRRPRPQRPLRKEEPLAMPPLAPLKKVSPSAKPMPDWMQKMLNERMGLSGKDIERAGY